MRNALKLMPGRKLGWSGAALGILTVSLALGAQSIVAPLEAPTGLDNQTNGAIDQAAFDGARGTFSEVEELEDGLGPVFNNTSCVGCHLSGGAAGGSSQVTVLRAGHYEGGVRGRQTSGRRDQNEQRRGFSFNSGPNFGGTFAPATVQLADGSSIVDRSLINQRAICADAQSTLSPQENITAQRISLSVLGDGYVEAVPDETLRAIAAFQTSSTRGRIHGQAIDVPLLEFDGVTRVGRFGAKDQHASLLSFAADAYLNEMGITSVLLPDEVTMTCQPAGVPPINDQNGDINIFAAFMRATKAPSNTPPIPGGPGLAIFRDIECAVCHVESLTTAATGTPLVAGPYAYAVPVAIGNKVFHPFSDYLLHDIGTGDGIVQNGGEETANKLRTMPLWGLRTRTELMHDGASTTFDQAIMRHRGEALNSTQRYARMTLQQKQALWAFLRGL
jgi:CxxC motif-containing protein (DUF1111 family)